jgi:hypothetical protein
MKFRKKPIVIEAEQWQPGEVIAGVEEVAPELLFSMSGEHYYLSAFPRPPVGKRMADAWLPVDPTASDERAGAILPFAFWGVKSGERRRAGPDDPLVKRYLEYAGWPTLPLAIGRIETLEGRMVVDPGDWIITGVKGERYPCKPDIFEATYEECEDRS